MEVLATSEPEACDLAFEQVRQELDIPGSDSEAYSFLVRAVQVDPLETTEVDAQPEQPGKPPCPVCDGFGFIKDSDPEYLLRRCVQCDRFKDDDELLRYVWAKLTGASLDHPGEENENPPGQT